MEREQMEKELIALIDQLSEEEIAEVLHYIHRYMIEE